jgi:hypothetical protein
LLGFFQLRDPPGQSNWKLVAFLTFYCLLFTVVYLVFKDPYIHEVRKGGREGGQGLGGGKKEGKNGIR